jgi:hypothetical protein
MAAGLSPGTYTGTVVFSTPGLCHHLMTPTGVTIAVQ